MKEAFLTLDTGGSKSHVMLTDLCGDTIAESYFAGCGLSSDSDIELLPQLKREIDKMRSAEGIASLTVKRAVVNLGGKNKNQIQRTLAACLPGTPIDIFRESEAFLRRRWERPMARMPYCWRAPVALPSPGVRTEDSWPMDGAGRSVMRAAAMISGSGPSAGPFRRWRKKALSL